jgi:hypothetical protein
MDLKDLDPTWRSGHILREYKKMLEAEPTDTNRRNLARTMHDTLKNC